MKQLILACAIALSLSPVCSGQVVWQAPQNVQSARPQLTDRSLGPSDRVAVRVRTGDGCGSGSVCGPNLVLTNAHVVGTRIGRVVKVDAVINGQRVTVDGRVIMAAHSDKTLADWAVLKTEGLESIEPVKLSKDKPSGVHYTRGSPRCVWPLKASEVITARIEDNSTLWRWRPNSIGGQSGSGVWSRATGLQEGLLTWSWGGLGAGQQTSEIYRQAKNRSTDGPVRIRGMKNVETDIPDELQEMCVGGNGVIVENGFFAQSGLTDLPIWHGDDHRIDDPADDPPAEDCPCDDCPCDRPEQDRPGSQNPIFPLIVFAIAVVIAGVLASLGTIIGLRAAQRNAEPLPRPVEVTDIVTDTEKPASLLSRIFKRLFRSRR